MRVFVVDVHAPLQKHRGGLNLIGKTIGWCLKIYPTEQYNPSTYQEEKFDLSRLPVDVYKALYKEAYESLDKNTRKSENRAMGHCTGQK